MPISPSQQQLIDDFKRRQAKELAAARRHAAPIINGVRAGRLKPEQKRAVWELIKTEKPALARLIRDDPVYRGMIDTFNAELILPRDLVERAFNQQQPRGG